MKPTCVATGNLVFCLVGALWFWGCPDRRPACEAYTHRCGDGCVSDYSPENCGRLCTPCPEPPGGNGQASCDGTDCGIACDPGYLLQDGDCREEAGPDYLQIATWNLEWFDAQDPPAKKQAIADIVRDNGFDLVGVQEVYDGQDLAGFIAAYLDDRVWDYRLGDSGESLRVGFIYRSDLLSVSDTGELNYTKSQYTIDDSGYPWAGMRLPYFARVSARSGTTAFDLVVVHLKATGDDFSCAVRRAQAEDLADWIAASAPDRLVLLGDYNDELPGVGICVSVDTLAPLEDYPGLQFITAQPAYLSDLAYTYIPYQSTIDHILVTRDLLPRLADLDAAGHKASVVMHGDTGVSDHQPVFSWIGPE